MSKKPFKGQKPRENNTSANGRMHDALKSFNLTKEQKRAFHDWLNRFFTKEERERMSYDECVRRIQGWLGQ